MAKQRDGESERELEMEEDDRGGKAVAVAVAVEGLFDALPEGCVANIVSFTSPRDACSLCLVSPAFRSAAESDAVWETFLPPDCQSLISRSASPPPLSKKHLYLSLSDSPLLIDNGKKSFSLDKLSGKKCYMISARDLSIIWGDTPRYWRWIPLPESRFPEVAELISVCWFEIRGKIDVRMLSPSTTYAAYLVFKSSGAYGFESQAVETTVGLVEGEATKRYVYLDAERGRRQRYQIVPRQFGRYYWSRIMESQPSVAVANDDNDVYPKERKDGWLEIELGDFFYGGDGQDGQLEMSVLEVNGGNWKGGLIFEGIEIRPKGV